LSGVARLEPAEIEERPAVQRSAENPHDPSKADEHVFFNFVSTHEFLVVAEVPQEPTNLSSCSRSAIETTVEGMALMFSWFEEGEPKNIERSLGMLPLEYSINVDEENALHDVFRVARFAVQSRNMAFHWAASCGLEQPLTWQISPSRRPCPLPRRERCP
jgi:hypothetical protein